MGNDLEDEELLRLWKGLFYCMWMSDKPAVQQELATEIASLTLRFPSPASAFQFLRCFLITMNREWHGIDNLRLNKFYSLIRRMIEASLQLALSDVYTAPEEEEDEESESETIFLFSRSLCESLQSDTCPAVVLHLADIFVDSLEKALPETKPGDQVLSELEISGLLMPFYDLLQASDDRRILNRVKDAIFLRLLNATYDEEYEVDEEVGDDATEKHQIQLLATRRYFIYFDSIEDALLSVAKSKETREQNRTALYQLHETFQKARVPEAPKSQRSQPVIYKPLTSAEAAELPKRKRKKRKAAASRHPAKKRTRYQ